MMFEEGEEALPNLGEGEWLVGDRFADERKRDTGLITTILSGKIQRPKVITAGFAFFANIAIGMEISKVVFVLHR